MANVLLSRYPTILKTATRPATISAERMQKIYGTIVYTIATSVEPANSSIANEIITDLYCRDSQRISAKVKKRISWLNDKASWKLIVWPYKVVPM